MRQHATRSRHAILSLALGASLLLRVLVPAGYMPAPVADGWPLQLCPDGMPMAAMRALLGDGHHHHRHHGGPAAFAAANAGADAVADTAAAAMPAQCELGAGFAAATLLDSAGVPPSFVGAPTIVRRDPAAPTAPPHRPAYQSRAPPALTV